MNDKVIDFNKNPIQKLKKDLAKKEKELNELKEELKFYRSLYNSEKSINENMMICILDLQNNIDMLQSNMEVITKNLKGLYDKMEHIQKLRDKNKN